MCAGVGFGAWLGGLAGVIVAPGIFAIGVVQPDEELSSRRNAAGNVIIQCQLTAMLPHVP